MVDLYQSLHSNSASTTSISPSILTTGWSSILSTSRAPRKQSPCSSDKPILRWIANPETQLCTRCPDKLLSLEDQSKLPRWARKNSLFSPEKRGINCSQARARWRSWRSSWFSWTPKLSRMSWGIPSEIGIVRIYSWYPRLHTLFRFFFFPVPPPPDLNTSLNCSLCNPSTYAYPYHEGYVVLVYRQYTPKGPQTTSRNSWTWIKSHKGDKDLPKALCCWRTTIEDWDYRQLRKTSF